MGVGACVCGRCDSGSFVRKTDRMASVTSHVERGEGNTHSWTQHAAHRQCWEKTFLIQLKNESLNEIFSNSIRSSLNALALF